MRRIEMKTLDGRTIVELLPESEEDVEELRRMAEEGEVNDQEQMNDPTPTPSPRDRA